MAAMLASAIVAIGHAGAVSADPLPAQASGEDTLARCQQLYGLWSRHNTDGYARPLDARMGLQDCQKGNIAAGVATLGNHTTHNVTWNMSTASGGTAPAGSYKLFVEVTDYDGTGKWTSVDFMLTGMPSTMMVLF
jgi:hypothetical protein